MTLPRVRLSVRRLMVAVAIAAVVIVGEMGLYRQAAYEVGDGWDDGYSVHEANEVWAVVNVAIGFVAFLLYRVYRPDPPETT